jgi:N-methylhydantoinase B
MFMPLMFAGKRRAFAVVICHHTDVGGRVPGSNASDSTEIYQEGLRVPPLKLYERGKLNTTLEAMIKINVRVPDRVWGDLGAQPRSCASAPGRSFRRRRRGQGLPGRERSAHAERLAAARSDREGPTSSPTISTRRRSPARPSPSAAITVRDDGTCFDYHGSTPGEGRAQLSRARAFSSPI